MLTTPLYHAVMGRHRDAIELLIEMGADANQRCKYDRPLIVIAAYRRDREMVQLLLELGADVNARHGYHTALTIAIERNDWKLAEILLAYNAAIDRDWESYTIYRHRVRDVIERVYRGRLGREYFHYKLYGYPPTRTLCAGIEPKKKEPDSRRCHSVGSYHKRRGSIIDRCHVQ